MKKPNGILGMIDKTTTYTVAQKVATALEPCENSVEIDEVFRKAKEIWKLKQETVVTKNG